MRSAFHEGIPTHAYAPAAMRTVSAAARRGNARPSPVIRANTPRPVFKAAAARIEWRVPSQGMRMNAVRIDPAIDPIVLKAYTAPTDAPASVRAVRRIATAVGKSAPRRKHAG